MNAFVFLEYVFLIMSTLQYWDTYSSTVHVVQYSVVEIIQDLIDDYILLQNDTRLKNGTCLSHYFRIFIKVFVLVPWFFSF